MCLFCGAVLCWDVVRSGVVLAVLGDSCLNREHTADETSVS